MLFSKAPFPEFYSDFITYSCSWTINGFLQLTEEIWFPRDFTIRTLALHPALFHSSQQPSPIFSVQTGYSWSPKHAHPQALLPLHPISGAPPPSRSFKSFRIFLFLNFCCICGNFSFVILFYLNLFLFLWSASAEPIFSNLFKERSFDFINFSFVFVVF